MSEINSMDKEEKELQKIYELEKKIEVMDQYYVNSVMDEIHKYQPYYLTVMLSYKDDLVEEEMSEVINIYFLVWEYFRSIDGLRKKKVTQKQFEKFQYQTLHMLSYSADQPKNSRDDIFDKDLQSMKSKSLWTVVCMRSNEIPALVNMSSEKKGIILIGVKAFIQCFESL